MTNNFFSNFYGSIKEKGKNKTELINSLEKIFPNKAEKVIEVLNKGIFKYIYKPSNRCVWIALGENCEHIIYPKLYCSCQDFYKSVIIKRKRVFCKHILAQIISETLEIYKEVEFDDDDFRKLIDDLELKFK
ncbi:MAG: hypothetical protein ACFE8E_08785 [Candidatus Hodarchaeota archaeon]